MDLFINTLTGTVFELRVSPYEAILSIKAKLQRNEGIPISQQHLIWQSIELDDEYCLHDYNIKSGSTLTLVLAMRDGPINMRRISVEEPSFQDVVEYMDVNKEDMWDRLMNDDKQVTLLVFRDGDQLNFFRVYDRGDGVLSPYSDSLSSPSVIEVRDNGTVQSSTKVEKQQEEHLNTKNKMMLLRKKLAESGMKKKLQPRPPSAPRANSKTYRKRSIYQHGTISSRHGVRKDSIVSESENKSTPVANSHPLLPVRHKSKPDIDQHSNISEIRKTPLSLLTNIAECNTEFSRRSTDEDSISSMKTQDLLANLKDSPSPTYKTSTSKTLSSSKRRMLKPLGALNKNSASGFLSELKSPPISSPHKTYEKLPEISYESKLPSEGNRLSDTLHDSADRESYKKLLNWVRPQSSNRISTKHNTKPKAGIGHRPSSKTYRKSPESRTSIKVSTGKIHPHGNLTHLPPVRTAEKRLPPSLTGKKRTRCLVCGKKLGLATTYVCRCGSKYCSLHRYPETHSCTYDYKTEGRKLLEKNNPVVAAPKLPKI